VLIGDRRIRAPLGQVARDGRVISVRDLRHSLRGQVRTSAKCCHLGMGGECGGPDRSWNASGTPRISDQSNVRRFSSLVRVGKLWRRG
jgi:hypothetical protein